MLFLKCPLCSVLVLVFVVYNRRREAQIKYPGPEDDVRKETSQSINLVSYNNNLIFFKTTSINISARLTNWYFFMNIPLLEKKQWDLCVFNFSLISRWDIFSKFVIFCAIMDSGRTRLSANFSVFFGGRNVLTTPLLTKRCLCCPLAVQMWLRILRWNCWTSILLLAIHSLSTGGF